MKLILAFVLLFSIQTMAKEKAPAKAAKKAAAVSENLAAKLEAHRKAIAPDLDSAKQFKKFDAALGDLCSSLQSDEAEMGNDEYMKQMLLLTDRLLEVDTGKNAMDCFGGYYEGRHDMIQKVIKTLPNPERQRLEEEIKLFQQAVSSEAE